MKTRVVLVMVCAGVGWFWAQSATAGPSLVVSKPPVQSTTVLTGPPVDPAATNGQWFIDSQGTETVRTNEFYDHIGGGTAGAYVITGYVDSVAYMMGGGIGSPLAGFTIQATIHNDASPEALWTSGSNSHGETLATQDPPYVGPLVDAMLVAEFAIADYVRLPQIFQGPYRDRTPWIEAVNENQWAWYCWNPDDQDPDHKPQGGYYVPAWNFGTIPLGQSATIQLRFSVAMPGIPFTDSRYMAILSSYNGKSDILQNRTTSLKISTWIDDIALDTGTDQSELPLRHSDVSVFHNQIGEEPELLDFGDAPDQPYPTRLINNGARHVIVLGAPWFGDLTDVPDPEPDGQPDPAALGDDKDVLYPPVNDDEDGVSIPPLTIGQTSTVAVTVSGPPAGGWVDAWFDWNGNGIWEEPAERIYGGPMPLGLNAILVTPPAGSPPGTNFARFRIHSAQGNLPPTGLASDGEVEDHELLIQEVEPDLDFGDAMDRPTGLGMYPTLLVNNGARHVIVPGVFLGQSVDAEHDGQPTPNADGDDLYPPPLPPLMGDEDGVAIPKPLVAGAAVQVQVTASVSGYLNAWIDWNSDGDWADPGEQVYMNWSLNSGLNLLPLNVPVPPALVAGGPHSRWRFTTYPTMSPMANYLGLETDGEVEDHEVQLEVFDFGDAPDSYQTLLASDGARHRIPSAYWLGAIAPDLEPDGQPTAGADGDDNAGNDDEDLVATTAKLVQGQIRTIVASASTNGFLNIWIDFNQNGTWAEPGEQAVVDLALVPGTNPVPIATPQVARLGPTFARVRFCSYRGLGPAGLASDGEVEDYAVTVYQAGPDTNVFRITNVVYAATNTATIGWAGESNVTYETQYATNLLSDSNVSWTAWGGWVTAAPHVQTDGNAVETTRFYRVIAPWSPPPP